MPQFIYQKRKILGDNFWQPMAAHYLRAWWQHNENSRKLLTIFVGPCVNKLAKFFVLVSQKLKKLNESIWKRTVREKIKYKIFPSIPTPLQPLPPPTLLSQTHPHKPSYPLALALYRSCFSFLAPALAF